MSSERIGSSFESFLEEEGIRNEVEAVAQKRVFAWQIQQAMEAAGNSGENETNPNIQDTFPSDALHAASTVRTRRSSPARDPLMKASVQMHTSTLEAVKQAVERGAAASQNEFVEGAVIARLRELRRENVYASYRAAAADPAYFEEMNAVTAAFDATVADGLGEKDS